MTDFSRTRRGERDGTRRRSALDRLDTVAADRAVRDPVSVGAARVDSESRELPPPRRRSEEPGAESTATDEKDAGAEPQDMGWGIAAMPAWLDPDAAKRGSSAAADDFSLDEFDDEPGDDEFADDERGLRRRVAIAPPAAIAIIAVGVIACVVAAFGLFGGDEQVPEIDFPEAGAPASTAAQAPVDASAVPSSPPPTAATVVVSVVGLVHKPGLVTLAASARVADAIAAAGGAREAADTVSLNLAQVLHDGDQVLVGYAGPDGRRAMRSAVVSASGAASGASDGGAAGGGASGGAASGSGSGLVNLNTATEQELDALPGVGPVTAQAILDWRSRNGSFSSVDQLGEVDGIGPARLAKLRELVTV